MENIVINIVSVIIQTLTWSYFLEKFCKLITKSSYSKKQIIVHTVFIFIATISGTLTKNIIPFLNTVITWIVIFVDLKLWLKVPFFKTILSILSIYILLIITELISFFICRQIFRISSEELFNSAKLLLLVIIIQMILTVLISQLTNIKQIKKMDFRKIFHLYTKRQWIIIILLIFFATCPQFIIFMFNKYNYPAYFLLLNSTQMITICIVIFSLFKNSMEKEKAEHDLIAVTLHNKTMTGMVDGVKKLKHDYSNIFQSLNGYISTKQYDKL